MAPRKIWDEPSTDVIAELNPPAVIDSAVTSDSLLSLRVRMISLTIEDTSEVSDIYPPSSFLS
jgi:hypothetical protein